MRSVSQIQIGKAINSCEHQDFIRYYLQDFIRYKFNSVPVECYEVRTYLQCLYLKSNPFGFFTDDCLLIPK